MAGRPKGTTKKKKVVDERFQPKDVQTPFCMNCGQNSGKVNSFYISKNPIHTFNSCRLPLCKNCLEEIYTELYKKYGRSDLAIYYLCRQVDCYYSTVAFEGAESTSLKLGQGLVSSYFRMLNSLSTISTTGTSFADSKNFLDLEILEEKYRSGKIETVNNGETIVTPDSFTEEDEINRNDCIKLLGYDPFFDNEKRDQKFLYNTLLPFLDDATLEDAFKLPSVIELVKSLGQVEKLNKTFTTMMASTDNIEENASKVSTLVTSKDKLYRSILAMAKDNGISVNHALNKSQGAGTLSRIVKELDEIGLRDAKINLFNIETSESMKQTADISNKSILEQINLQDSELWDMIAELREVRIKLDKKVSELEELLRLERVKTSDLTDIQNQMQQYINELEDKYNKLNNSKYKQIDS